MTSCRHASADELGTRGIVVLRDGQLIGERYAEGFDAETPQLGWSMGKSVTNLLLGRMVLQGGSPLDDTGCARTGPTPARTSASTSCCRMTSGLTWDETYALGTPITQMLYAEPDMAALRREPAARAPARQRTSSTRAGRPTCSAGCSPTSPTPRTADLPRQQLFAPARPDLGGLGGRRRGTPVCSSYLWATPRDWATIGEFALKDGVWAGERLLPEGWMTQTTTATPVATSEEKGYAGGWWVNRRADGSLVDPTLPEDAYWASGHDGQRLYVVPSAGLVVARLGFSPEVDSADLKHRPSWSPSWWPCGRRSSGGTVSFRARR